MCFVGAPAGFIVDAFARRLVARACAKACIELKAAILLVSALDQDATVSFRLVLRYKADGQRCVGMRI